MFDEKFALLSQILCEKVINVLFCCCVVVVGSCVVGVYLFFPPLLKEMGGAEFILEVWSCVFRRLVLLLINFVLPVLLLLKHARALINWHGK